MAFSEKSSSLDIRVGSRPSKEWLIGHLVRFIYWSVYYVTVFVSLSLTGVLVSLDSARQGVSLCTGYLVVVPTMVASSRAGSQL